MPKRTHPDLSLNAERRATTPGGPVRVEKTIGRAPAAKKEQQPKSPALTRREQRIKRILLKELDKLQRQQLGGGLTYVEKQRLDKALDVAFIDREIAKMQKQLRRLPWIAGVFGALLLMLVLAGLWPLLTGAASFGWSDLNNVIILLAGVIGPLTTARSIRRKLWIYEALRELSDADEMDVTLGRAAEEADALIARIVDHELDLEDRLPARPRTRAR